MAYTTVNPVTVGDPTKSDHYDDVFDNTIENKDRLDAHTHDGTESDVQVVTGGIADNAVTEAKIADTDLPIAARSYVSTESSGTSTAWTENFDGDSNMDTFDFGGGDIRARYNVPSNGLYYVHAQAIHDSLNTLAITNDGGTALANCPNISSTGGAVSGIFKLTSSDYIKFAYTHAGGNFTTGSANTFFEVRKLPWTTAY
jgi:hypothetical protein